MDSTLISLLALIVSALAIPCSYFVATHQVRVGLNEHERRVRQRTRTIVADRLDELISMFFGAAKGLANIDLRRSDYDRVELGRQLATIDRAVINTGILERLAKAIDDYAESGDPRFQSDKATASKLSAIRGQIHRGSSSPERHATWDILDSCAGGGLAAQLRKED